MTNTQSKSVHKALDLIADSLNAIWRLYADRTKHPEVKLFALLKCEDENAVLDAYLALHFQRIAYNATWAASHLGFGDGRDAFKELTAVGDKAEKEECKRPSRTCKCSR